MSRAYNIWIVRNIEDGYRSDPVGAFTVRRELVNWLERDDTDTYGLTITVVRDGNLVYDDPMEKWIVAPQTISANEFLQRVRGGG